jgi:hypothetical protein
MTGFTPVGAAYRSKPDATLVPLHNLEPPFRLTEVPLDFRGFCRNRMTDILIGFAARAEIAPVVVVNYPPVDMRPALFQYRIWDGFHRYYASVAAGFGYLPVVIV